jgi:hypothetical protein
MEDLSWEADTLSVSQKILCIYENGHSLQWSQESATDLTLSRQNLVVVSFFWNFATTVYVFLISTIRAT